jgi:pimeloyl-ACP methyl ester carboxylesterase
VLDYLLARTDVDGDWVALVGLSLGAHLAPRAASADHRISACIADCGSYDLFASALERIPGPLASGLAEGRKSAVLARVLGFLAAQPTAGWALRRGQLVHGVDEPIEYLLALRDYSLKGRAESISCPTFVCHAEGDDISASAPQLVAALTATPGNEFVRFTAADGAGDHCEAAARTLFHARAFAWLDRIRPRPDQGES